MGRYPLLTRTPSVGPSRWGALACVGIFTMLSGCTRRLQLGNPENDSPASTDLDTGDDSQVGGEPGLERRLCVAGTVADFQLPSARWALSVAFASRSLQHLTGNQMRLSPEWFLASAWQSDYFGCGGYGAPWSDEESGTEGGCMAIQSGTHWSEISRLFPDTFDVDDWPDLVDGDRPEASAIAIAHAVYAGHLLLRRVDGIDPDAWLASSADPAATPRLATLLHAEGPWSESAAVAVQDCADDVYACTDSSTQHYATQVELKLQELASAPCATITVSEDDLEAFLDGLETVWPGASWADIRPAAHAARTSGYLDADGIAILEAIESTLDRPLRCPEATLWDFYRYSCN